MLRSILAALFLVQMASAVVLANDLRSYTKDKNFEDLTPAEHAAAKAEARNRKVPVLRVCADPGNMPQSNTKSEGYQNKIIALLAEDLGGRVDYFWRPYHERGLTRETFQNDECDLLLDMPVALQSLLTTEPMYRTAYVLAYRSERKYDFKSLDDPRLKELKVGVFQHSGIREVLERRGVKRNLQLRTITYDSDLVEEHQPWRQVQKVVDGELDVAAVWGPFAGWLQKMKGAPLTIQPVNEMDDKVPLEFDLAVGMRPNNVLLKYMLDWALTRKAKEIEAILKDYGVPLVRCSKCAVDGDIPSNGAIYARLRNSTQDRYLKQEESLQLNADATPDQIVTMDRMKEWLADGADAQAELSNAVIANAPDRVAFLLQHGADVNGRDNQGYAPLHHAARSRMAPMVTELVGRGADINARDGDGFTPLLHAINRNHVPTIDALIAAKADIELATTQGIRPLPWAIGDGKYFAAKALIDLGADVDSVSGKEEVTPLMVTATQMSAQSRTGHIVQGPPPTEIAEMLIAKGAKVDHRSKEGVTALMVAAGHNNAPLIGLLANAGADPALRSHEGLTALEIAERARNETAIGTLKFLTPSAGIPNKPSVPSTSHE